MRDDLRMIDANLNRASEGLRVLEDVARFVLDHAELVGILKSARHDLRAAITSAGIDGLGLAASRDTPGDIGTGISSREGLGGRGERRRETLHDLCGAAASRTAEALRVIEECLKLGDGPSREAGAAVQGIRYQAYTSASRLLLSLGTDRATQWRLCVLVSERLCPGRPWEALVESVLAGGADCVQLREKNLPDRELLRRAQQLVAMTRAAGAAAFINDRVDIALLSGADGVHLGEEDLSVAGARKLCGGRVLVGASTSSIEQARAAVHAGADVCGVGPMFPTTTKHKPALAGPAYLSAYLSNEATARVPHLAIGGITPENVGELVAAGCRGVAVSSAVCGADNPGAVCRAILNALTQAPNQHRSPAGRLAARGAARG